MKAEIGTSHFGAKIEVENGDLLVSRDKADFSIDISQLSKYPDIEFIRLSPMGGLHLLIFFKNRRTLRIDFDVEGKTIFSWDKTDYLGPGSYLCSDLTWEQMENYGKRPFGLFQLPLLDLSKEPVIK